MDREHYIIIDKQTEDLTTRDANVVWSESEALLALQEFYYDDIPDYVLYCNPAENTVRDISADLAEQWLAIIVSTFNPDVDVLPDFIARHAKPDLDELRREIEAERKHRGEVASPYWAGRV